MTIRGISSELRKVVEFAESLGFTVERTKGLHLKLLKPGRPVVFTSGTPGDNRAIKNIIAQLKRVEREHAEKQSA